MFLYNISRNKLLILRKIFIKLLDKNFIYINNFLIAISVLFIKKLNRELYFYINYRALNILIRKDRYLLLLIKKTFNSFSEIKWFIKLNIIITFYKIRIIKREE